jgi:uncharacterized protein (TIGR01777 family)
MKTILITGGSGLIGKYLSKLLKDKGYRLHVLSRGADQVPGFDKTFVWDVDRGTMDEKALEGVTHIVHLAGAGIADSAWTDARKKLIIDSRVKSLELIHRTLKAQNKQIEALISGSAVGWYGAISDEKLHSESESNATDFMGKTCAAWENAASAFEDVTSRIVKIRTGVVLAKEGGALPQMMKPFKFYVGSALGSGKQQIPWIHIRDIAAIFAEAIDNEAYSGPINASATEECSNETFSKTLAKTMHKPFIPIAVPSIFLKLALGDMSKVVLEGSRVSNKKLGSLGYTFEFDDLQKALSDLLKH